VLLACLAAGPVSSEVAQAEPIEQSNAVHLELAFASVARQVAPATVAIVASQDAAPVDAPAGTIELSPQRLDELLAGRSRTSGSGVCIDPRGYILTNQHVVSDAKQLYVVTDGGRVMPAMVVATDPRGDLALIKVPRPLPAVEFAKTPARRGQWAVALGNPIGLGEHGKMAVSAGLVSAVGRELPMLSAREGRHYANLIQTTAQLNPGNSGGPLVDLEGRLLGLVTAVVLPRPEAPNGLGFALPLDAAAQRRVEMMKTGRPPVYGYLGVAGRDAADVPGLLVTRVGRNTPAEGSLRPGDVILAMAGKQVDGEEAFIRRVGQSEPAAPVAFRVRRGSRIVDVTVRLLPRPDANGIGHKQQRLTWRGVTFRNSDAGVRVDAVSPDSPVIRDFAVGQVVHEYAGRPTRDLVALQAALDQ
jgi:S1-C subfamily serine protease